MKKKFIFTRKYCYLFLIFLFYVSGNVSSQQVYFVDGYHGGVFGHYPMWKTQFMTDKLSEYPEWKLGMEIEAETWDSVRVNTPEAYQNFRKIVYDSRLDFTNPTLAQPYCYNISGESIIRQFHYGIKKNHEHFPGLTFTTYAVEEPCFTSSLPQILKSFGFKYAVLKCPNTCWGGYMKAYGEELVNWIGPDGTSILTVPRYECEDLEPNSVWQTTAWGNSEEYLQACINAGIRHPVGMTYQDAGWKNGPWLGYGEEVKNNSQYVTWTEYIENISIGKTDDNYFLSQDDVLVALMWGSQALQRIGQQVRISENKIIQAEKIATMANLEKNFRASEEDIENAWRSLLMAQHHDSWIVPYNRFDRINNRTWAQEIELWTKNTDQISDEIIRQADLILANGNPKSEALGFVKIYNTLPEIRKEVISITLPENSSSKRISVFNINNKAIKSIRQSDNTILCEVEVPAFGYTTLRLEENKSEIKPIKNIRIEPNGDHILENNMYKIVFDASKGGRIKSLIAKKLNNKEFVDSNNTFGFNEIRGYFYDQELFFSNTENKAEINILENNELTQKIEIKTNIDGHPVIQTIALAKDQERIDFSLYIDWKKNVGIGEFRQEDSWKANHRACYDDRYKLHILFPAALNSQRIYKNAPFDVCKSHLDNTFFKTWDSIKHNVILNWVDMLQEDEKYGLALLSDHTTSYLHGEDYPLGLTAQYSGKGLWNVDYKITRPLDIRYALIPHENKWDESNLWTASNSWNEPLIATFHPATNMVEKSFIRLNKKGYELSAITNDDDGNLFIRIFNAENDNKPVELAFDFPVKSVSEIELNGEEKQKMSFEKRKNFSVINTALPQFGIKTFKITR